MLRGGLRFLESGKWFLQDPRGWCGVWEDITVGDVTGFNVITLQGSSIYFSSRTLTPEKTFSHPDHNHHSLDLPSPHILRRVPTMTAMDSINPKKMHTIPPLCPRPDCNAIILVAILIRDVSSRALRN